MSGMADDELIRFASTGDMNSLMQSLEATAIDLQVNDRHLISLLCYHASSKGQLAVVSYLLEKGSLKDMLDVEASCGLHAAAKFGHVEIVKFLVERGADVDQLTYDGPDHNKYTPLHVAAIAGRLSVVEYLVAHGATIDIECTGWLRTPLMEAAGYGSLSIVQFLIEKGASIDKADVNGVTPLHRAAQWSHLFVLKYLIEKGADKDKVAEGRDGGLTALTFATNEEVRSYLRALDGLKMSVTEDSLSTLKSPQCSLWFDMILLDYPGATDKVQQFVAAYPELAFLKDAQGRVAMDMAIQSSRQVMQTLLLWHGRYSITERRPEHTSATCYVFKAIDERTIDHETGQPVKVALKLMRDKAQFQRELTARDKGFAHEYVMNVLQTHPHLVDLDKWGEEVAVEADATGQLTKANAEKLFLLVMPLVRAHVFYTVVGK